MHMVKIGLFGLGTVGQGLLQLVKKSPYAEIKAVVDRSYQKKKDILQDIPASDDPSMILENPEIDIYVELIGGIDFPLFIAREAIDRKKTLITANKALLAEHGYAIFSRASLNEVHIGFEAAIAGAIPIVRNLMSVINYQPISRLQGILNGTTNYLLTKMAKRKAPYHEVLKEAQELGLAEADPTLDVNGMDACHKLALLASLITNKWFEYERIETVGIEQISLSDILWAEKMGYKIKLLADYHYNDKKHFISVEPTMIPSSSPLYAIDNEDNAILVKGEFSGEHLFAGKGAGSLPTAYSVYADIVNYALGRHSSWDMKHPEYAAIAPESGADYEFYIRLQVQNRPGVLAKAAQSLGSRGISIAAVHQEAIYEENSQDPVDLVIVTHHCRKEVLTKALAEIEKQDYCTNAAVKIPIKGSDTPKK
ncbi:MAG: homoserine dehydrogenase [Candidatus Hydrogenedentota bacterium]|nr:MAG: homoserine dehydrogenase [Candidatus Hydrogenedentota bacterium]